MTAPLLPPSARETPCPAAVVRAPGGLAFLSAGPIVSGVSMATKRAHAADQPSGVSGHDSSGLDRDVPTAQIA